MQYIEIHTLPSGHLGVLSFRGWLSLYTEAAIINYLIILSFLGVLFGITGRYIFSYSVLSLFILVLTIAEYIKVKSMGIPVLPWDLFKIGEALWTVRIVLGNGLFYVITTLIILFLSLFLIKFILGKIKSFKKRKKDRLIYSFRFLSLILSLFFLISIFRYWESPARKYIENLGEGAMLYNEKLTYERNGFFFSFALNGYYMQIQKPNEYNKGAVQELSRDIYIDKNVNKPTIIMLMSESFWDITNIEGLNLNTDPIPNVRRMMEEGNGFLMASSEVGGGTANVEFEALTGLSTAFLPGGSIAYQQFIKNKMPSLPNYLKTFGYDTIAIHPYEGSFWNREKVYKKMGFDEFISIEDLDNPAHKGSFVSDEELVRLIIDKYESTQSPAFIFGISMQNHYPYVSGYYEENNFKVENNLLSRETRGAYECFSQGLYDADRALGELIDYFKDKDEPFNIIFFGDHIPAIEGADVSRLSDTSASGFIDRNSPYFDSLKNKFTPAVFWSNYGAEVPDVNGHQYSCMAFAALDFASIPKNSYYTHLSEIFSEFPIIQNGLAVNKKGEIMPLKDVQADLFERLHKINYDAIFGKAYFFDYLWEN